MPDPNLDTLLDNNRRWAAESVARDPDYFNRLVAQQAPQFLWIGCSDSRVPANQITGLAPGEVFVHRNVANVVAHSDLNCLAVVQFSVDVLKVRHVIVCGHYGCGGVRAAMDDLRLGMVDNWIRHVKDVRVTHREQLSAIGDPDKRHARLCELNVIEQVVNVCQTTVVQDAWSRGQDLTVHGWVYALSDGILRDLGMTTRSPDELSTNYTGAVRMPAPS